MSDHFIKNIEIKNFKCFEDFKAEGFGRVNLIGGKNNVGKTAFMEAVYVNVYSSYQSIEGFVSSLLNIKLAREKINLLYNQNKEFFKEKEIIESYDKLFIKSNIDGLLYEIEKLKNGIKRYIFTWDDGEVIDVNVNDFSFDTTLFKHIKFLDTMGLSNLHLKEYYASLQEEEKESYLNNILNSFDAQIENFKIINDVSQCKIKNSYIEITELGDGTKHLISIILSLFSAKNGFLFIDEIGNGIHYTNLDKLWEIILTISKQQNVQVFATTHSKECIESYARVAKKLEDEEIKFIELGKNKKDELKAMVYPYEWFIDEIEQNHEVRGW